MEYIKELIDSISEHAFTTISEATFITSMILTIIDYATGKKPVRLLLNLLLGPKRFYFRLLFQLTFASCGVFIACFFLILIVSFILDMLSKKKFCIKTELKKLSAWLSYDLASLALMGVQGSIELWCSLAHLMRVFYLPMLSFGITGIMIKFLIPADFIVLFFLLRKRYMSFNDLQEITRNRGSAK